MLAIWFRGIDSVRVKKGGTRGPGRGLTFEKVALVMRAAMESVSLNLENVRLTFYFDKLVLVVYIVISE